VVASRLSEDESRRVLLLDAGPDFPDEEEVLPLFAVSGEHSWLVAGVPELDWRYWNTDGAGATSGHRVRLARGKLVGGTSMVNATIAARGAPYDYDRWERMGNPGWAWDDLLPYFIRIENDLDFGDQPIHGSNGPIRVQRYKPETWAAVNHAFYEGCTQLGLHEAPDLNALDAHENVVGAMAHNRFNEIRQGTLVTYIRAARKRPNFTVRGDATVDRVLLDGTRATGVRYLDATGTAVEVSADVVVVSAGVYGSPAILQRSGIGPAEVLRSLGIQPVVNLPVGCHLLDHPGCAVLFRAPALSGATGRLFATNARGPNNSDGEMDWQVHPFPTGHETGMAGLWIYLPRMDAEGVVQITGADPTAAPLIDHRYNTLESDIQRFERAWEFCLELLHTPAFAAHGAKSIHDGKTVREVLRGGIASANHQVGTCKMGKADDPTAVVDHNLRVHGVDNLLVADASIYPDNIMHNTNFTCMVIGEIAADLLRGERVVQ
jgi:choline dehydrogenase